MVWLCQSSNLTIYLQFNIEQTCHSIVEDKQGLYNRFIVAVWTLISMWRVIYSKRDCTKCIFSLEIQHGDVVPYRITILHTIRQFHKISFVKKPYKNAVLLNKKWRRTTIDLQFLRKKAANCVFKHVALWHANKQHLIWGSFHTIEFFLLFVRFLKIFVSFQK